MSIAMHKEKQIRAKKLQYARTDSSKEISSNKLNTGAMLEAIYDQIYREESRPDGGSGRSTALAEYDQLDEIIVEQFQMSAKAFVDQMFMDRKFIGKEWERSESRPFSDALEILKSNEDLWEKIKYQHGHSSKGSLTSRPSENVVVLKPKSKNTKYSENVSCHCSMLQSHHRSSKVPNVKSTPFSFSEMKRKFKYSFGRTKKEPYPTLVDVTTLELSRSKLTSGDESTCRGMDTGNSVNLSTSAKSKDKNQGKSSCGPEDSSMNEPVRNKSNSSGVSFPGKHEFDVILEAKRHLSARLENLKAIETRTSKRCPKILERILSSPEQDIWLSSPSREKESDSASAQMRFSPYSNSPAANIRSCQMQKGKQKTYISPLIQNEEATSSDDDLRKYDSMLEIFDPNTNFSLIESADTEVLENIDFTTVDLKANGRAKIVEESESIPNPGIISASEGPSEFSSTDVPSTMQKTNIIEMLEEDVMHLRLDSPSALDDSPWTPLSIYQLDDSTKDREEHPSPVSVLEPFFTEDVNSPPSIILKRAGQPLQPRRLDYEEFSSEASPVDPTIIPTTRIDGKDSISGYVYAVLQASHLNWAELSAIMPLTEQLIYGSLFDEVEFPSTNSPYDPKLLFDHINEVLLEVHQSHFGLPPWILSFIKPKIQFAPLEQHVVDEVLKEADFYLLPRTEKRTLDQLVGKDTANSRWRLGNRLQTEEIVSQISEYVLEESILYLMLDFDK